MKTILTKCIEEAAEYLRQGELVAFPTETVYGLGAVIDCERALKKIYEVKGRPKDNPLIVHIHTIEQMYELVEEVNDKALDLIENFWPGPLTLIFEKKNNLNETLTAGLQTIAIRLPAHRIARNLIKALGRPIAAPSANLSGKPSATNYKHVLEDFDSLISCVLKGDGIIKGLESTVIDCTHEPFRVLRLGSIELEKLERITLLDLSALNEKTNRPASPGMKYRHYAPKAKVILWQEAPQPPEGGAQISIKNIAYIGLSKPVNELFEMLCICSSIDEYAENLFSFFRECDNKNIQTIYCKLPPSEGLGLAIIDRLQKASQNN